MTYKDEYKEYLEWGKKQNSGWNKFSKQINPTQLVVFIILILGGNYLMLQGKLSSQFFWGAVAVVGVAIVFLMFRSTNEKKLIPEHIIKKIAEEALIRKRAKGTEIPFDAKIKVTLVSEAIYEQDLISGTSGIIKRDVGFQMIRKGLIQNGVISIHPYNGEIMGIRWEKLGYGGRGSRDRLIVPVSVVDQFDKKQD